MAARILNGREVADQVLADVRRQIEHEREGRRAPGLAAVLVGDDPASGVYVRTKFKACSRCGIESTLRHLPGTASQQDIAACVDALNADPDVDGILVQLPLPAHVDARAILARLDPGKDVDGLHVINLGKLASGDDSGFAPCTPAGVMELLQRSDVTLEGRRAVILGRSNLVGKPLALLMMRRAPGANATVTVVHTRSREVPALVREAEVVVAAAGSPHFVKADWLRPGAVVVDVGIHRRPDPARPGKHRLIGDVDFDAALPIASAITPVPGGVGPMTVAMLMSNTALAWRRHRGS